MLQPNIDSKNEEMSRVECLVKRANEVNRWAVANSLEERVDVAAQVARIDPVVQLVLVLDDDAHLVLRTFQLLNL